MIKQIVIAGFLTGVAILVGSFLHFPLFGGEVYLIGGVVFLMPIFLRIDLLIISTVISVCAADVISGYGHYTWMSAICYSLAVIVLWIFAKFKFKFIYMLGLLIASAIIIGGYFGLENIAFDMSYAIKDLFSTSLEMAIVFIFITIVYWPAKLLKTALFI